MGKRQVVGVFCIAEANIPEFNGTIRYGKRCRGIAVGNIVLFRENFHDARCTCARHDEHNKHHRQHDQRGENLRNIADETHEVASEHIACHNEVPADIAYCDHAEIEHVLGDGHVPNQKALSLDLRFAHGFCRGCKPRIFMLFTHKRLHHADGDQVFLHLRIHCVVLFEHRFEAWECPRADEN